MARINIDVSADDQSDADLAARLVAATFNTHGFDDVTNNSHPTHIDQEEDVVEAMHNLNPGIFQSEVIINATAFEEPVELAGADSPGDDEFLSDREEEDDGIDVLGDGDD
jgi:hypothetical protein